MTQQAEFRRAKCIIVIGFNGTGKSTIVKRIMLNELRKPEGRVLIVEPDDIEFLMIPEVNHRFPERIKNYVKARRLIYEEGCLEVIRDNFRKGLLVFDDQRDYLKDKVGPELHSLLIRRRQKEIDIIAVGHGFTEIQPKFYTFYDEIILFNTEDSLEGRRDVIKKSDMARLQEYQSRVNFRANDTTKAWTASGLIKDNMHYFEIIPRNEVRQPEQ